MAINSNFDPISQTAYYLSTVVNNEILATGTCFFIERSGDFYLITNWHNVTGKNPLNNEWLCYSAVSPELLRVKIYKNQEMLELIDFEVKLLDDEGNRLWFEHPTYFHNVDVVAIKVTIPDDMIVMSPETFIEPFNENTEAAVKDDVFILGYPFGLTVGNIFPIWKRASIASEPTIDIDNLPKLYVDTATRQGMSGSPVIYKERRQMSIGDGDPGTPNVKFSRNHMKFIGIYSGRIGDDEMKAQLGIVWKSRVIDEIIYQKVETET